jgi:hypothetical protein
MLTWLDGRNASSFGGLTWSNGTLGFTIGVGSGANQLTAMLPATGPNGTTLSSLSRGGTSVTYTLSTVKGQQYAMFPAAGGSYQATYAAAAPATLSAARTASVTQDSATVQWQTTAPATSTVRVGTSPQALTTTETVAGSSGDHEVALDALTPGETYYYRVSSTDARGRTRVWPARSAAPASFTTDRRDTTAPRVRDVRTLSLPDGTAQVTWTTDEPATSRVDYASGTRSSRGHGIDDALVRRHSLVLTGLAPGRTYRLRVGSADASGNAARPAAATLATVGAGVAVQTAQEFRTGTTRGRLYVGTRGLGELTLHGPGTGSYLSEVVDTGRKVDWRQALVKATRPAGSTVSVQVRTGPTPVPDRTWSTWRDAGSRLGTSGRFLQYRVRLTATGRALPSVSAVGFTHTGGLPPQSPEVRARHR